MTTTTNLPLQLIRAITEPTDHTERQRNLDYAVRSGITAESMLVLGESSPAHLTWLRIESIVAATSVVPHLSYIKAQYPTFDSTMPALMYPLDELVRQIKWEIERAELDKIAALVDEATTDPSKGGLTAALEAVIAAMDRLDVGALTAELEATYTQHVDYMTGEVQHEDTGVAWPWGAGTVIPRGIQARELVMLWGGTGTGKTWMALDIVMSAIRQGKRVLFVSHEMQLEDVLPRLVAMRSKVAPIDGRVSDRTRLDLREEERFQLDLACVRVGEWLFGVEDIEPVLRVSDLGASRGIDCGVAQLHREVREFQPDLVVVDTAYTLSPIPVPGKPTKANHERIALVTQQLKHLASRERVAMVAVHQSNEHEAVKGAGGKLSMAGSKQAIAWADLALSCAYDEVAQETHVWVEKTRGFELKKRGFVLDRSLPYDLCILLGRQPRTAQEIADEIKRRRKEEAKEASNDATRQAAVAAWSQSRDGGLSNGSLLSALDDADAAVEASQRGA